MEGAPPLTRGQRICEAACHQAQQLAIVRSFKAAPLGRHVCDLDARCFEAAADHNLFVLRVGARSRQRPQKPHSPEGATCRAAQRAARRVAQLPAFFLLRTAPGQLATSSWASCRSSPCQPPPSDSPWPWAGHAPGQLSPLSLWGLSSGPFNS